MNRIFFILILMTSFNALYAQDKAKYDVRYNTTAYRLLALEEDYSNLPPEKKRAFYDSMYKKLDLLIDTAKNKLAKFIHKDSVITQEDALKILSSIDSILTEQYFIVCIQVEKFSDALTPKKLTEFTCSKYLPGYRYEFCKNHRDSLYYGIDCDLGALLYLSIGEVLNLPLYFIEVPGHNFIRWELADKSYINWDNNSGARYSDNDFRNGLTPTESKSFTLQEEKLNHFLTNMSQDDIKGYYLSLIAIELSHQGRYSEAEQLYSKSIEYRPYDALSSNNLSWMYLTVPQFKNRKTYQNAYQLSVKVDSLLPGEIEYRDTYSCACAAVGKFKKATEIEKTARNKERRIEGYKVKKTCLDLGETIW